MTDENMKSALDAALASVPDGYWTILLCGPIPRFGEEQAPGQVDIAMTTTPEIMKGIVLRVAKKIQEQQTSDGPDPSRN